MTLDDITYNIPENSPKAIVFSPMLNINDARIGRFVLAYLSHRYQEISYKVDFDTYKGLNPNKISNHINDVIKVLERYGISTVENEISDIINNNLVVIDTFNWIDINNKRQCNFLSIIVLISQFQFSPPSQSFDLILTGDAPLYPLPLKMQDRYQSIIDIVDVFKVPDQIVGEMIQISSIEHKSRIINNLKNKWLEIEPLSKLYDSFFEKDDYYEQRMEWAWSYVKKNEWNHSIIEPNSTDSHEDLIKATFDIYPDSFGAVENLFKKMRNAWYQKKSKSGNTERKNYSISMSVEKMAKLDEIKAFHGKSRTFVLENLIDRAHKKMLKDQKEVDLLGEDDD